MRKVFFPFDPVLVYYLIISGVFLASFFVCYIMTHSKLWLGLFLITASLAFFFCFFFRDPERNITSDPKAIVSAADGKVLAIELVTESEYIKGEAIQIITFLSPLNVHVNRSPIAGKVEWIKKTKGYHKPAFSPDAKLNEQNEIGLVNDKGQKFLIKQIVGTLARRILCRLEIGQTIKTGERIGIIQFGSRTDVFIPPDSEVTVKAGDLIKGGETIIGVLK